MRKFKQFTSAAVLTIVLTSSVFAGDISVGRSGDISVGRADAAYTNAGDISVGKLDSMTTTLFTILQNMFSLI